jgi:hypothetical protein
MATEIDECCDISEYNKCHTSTAQLLCNKCSTDCALDMDNLPPTLRKLWYNYYRIMRLSNLPQYISEIQGNDCIYFNNKSTKPSTKYFKISRSSSLIHFNYSNYRTQGIQEYSHYISLQCIHLLAWDISRHIGAYDYIPQSVKIILSNDTQPTYNDNLPIYLIDAGNACNIDIDLDIDLDLDMYEGLKDLFHYCVHKYNPMYGSSRNLPIQFAA